MNTVKTSRIESTDSDATLELAARIGRNLRGGEVIELLSDLGGGKTTFVRGLAAGLGSRDAVRSPSFTLNNQYQAGELVLHHFDFYRLNGPGIMNDQLAEVLTDSHAVVVIEWGDQIRGLLPPQRLIIRIKPTGQTTRQFTFSYSESLSHLISKT